LGGLETDRFATTCDVVIGALLKGDVADAAIVPL
jgi:hypothetical protein